MSERLRRATSGNFRDSLAQAVLAGLARHPDQIDVHAEALMRLAASLPEAAAAVDFLLEAAESLEAGGNTPISATGILPPPPDNTRFTFLLEGSDPDDARQDLTEAIALLVERPRLEGAIAAATARFAVDPEGAFAEQQRLRKRKLEIDERIGHMARKRAAPASDNEQSAADGPAHSGEQQTD